MPLAITASNFADTPGITVDGRGGGVIKCAGDLLFEAVAEEGPAAGQALVEHARQRVDVGAGVDRVRSRKRSGAM